MAAKKKKQAKKAATPGADEGFVILLDDPDDTADDDANIVHLRRDCTIEEIEGIRQRLLTALDESEPMVVDLGAVKSVDSAFLQLLVSLRLEAQARGTGVSLRNQTESLMRSAATLDLTDQICAG